MNTHSLQDAASDALYMLHGTLRDDGLELMGKLGWYLDHCHHLNDEQAESLTTACYHVVGVFSPIQLALDSMGDVLDCPECKREISKLVRGRCRVCHEPVSGSMYFCSEACQMVASRAYRLRQDDHSGD